MLKEHIGLGLVGAAPAVVFIAIFVAAGGGASSAAVVFLIWFGGLVTGHAIAWHRNFEKFRQLRRELDDLIAKVGMGQRHDA